MVARCGKQEATPGILHIPVNHFRILGQPIEGRAGRPAFFIITAKSQPVDKFATVMASAALCNKTRKPDGNPRRRIFAARAAVHRAVDLIAIQLCVITSHKGTHAVSKHDDGHTRVFPARQIGQRLCIAREGLPAVLLTEVAQLLVICRASAVPDMIVGKNGKSLRAQIGSKRIITRYMLRHAM